MPITIIHMTHDKALRLVVESNIEALQRGLYGRGVKVSIYEFESEQEMADFFSDVEEPSEVAE